VKHGKINATIPPSADPAKLTLGEAVELLAAKSVKGSTGKEKPPAKAKGPKRKAA
jgi:topoisomerase IA-like protein